MNGLSESQAGWPTGHSVAADLPCHKCGYLLRGLPADGRCPECGTPIVESLMIVPERAVTAAAVRAIAWSRVVAAASWLPIAFSPGESDAALVAFWLLAMAASVMLLPPAKRLDYDCGLRAIPGVKPVVDRFRGMAILEALLYVTALLWWWLERRSPDAERLAGEFVQEGGPYFPLLLAAAIGMPRAHQMFSLCLRLAARCRRQDLGRAFVWMPFAFVLGGLALLTGWRWFRSPHLVLQLAIWLPVFAIAAAAVVQPMVLFRLAGAIRTSPTHWREDTAPGK